MKSGCKRDTFLWLFCTPIEFRQFHLTLVESMAGTTVLEPATSAVTGQRSNQLSYVPSFFSSTYAKSKNLLSFAAVYFFSRFHYFYGI